MIIADRSRCPLILWRYTEESYKAAQNNLVLEGNKRANHGSTYASGKFEARSDITMFSEYHYDFE